MLLFRVQNILIRGTRTLHIPNTVTFWKDLRFQEKRLVIVAFPLWLYRSSARESVGVDGWMWLIGTRRDESTGVSKSHLDGSLPR